MFRHNLRKLVVFSAVLAVVLSPKLSLAQVQKNKKAASKPVVSAEERLKRAYEKAFLGFDQGQATIRMIIEDTSTKSKKDRTLELKAKASKNGDSSFLIKFIKPGDIAGTAFLARNRKNQAGDQYIFLPALKIVKRVATGNAVSPFFGSDFLFGDFFLSAPDTNLEGIKIRDLPDRKMGSEKVNVVEVRPDFAGSPYSRMEVLISGSSGIIVGVNYYDLANKPLKELRIKKVKRMNGRLVPVHLTMTQERANSKTDIIVEKMDTSISLKEQDFTKQAMRR